MTNCKRCHKPVLDGQDTHDGDHRVCHIEFCKRLANWMCGRCGECEVSARCGEYEATTTCYGCIANNRDYKGYENLVND